MTRGKVCHECGEHLSHTNKNGYCRHCRGKLILCYQGAEANRGKVQRDKNLKEETAQVPSVIASNVLVAFTRKVKRDFKHFFID